MKRGLIILVLFIFLYKGNLFAQATYQYPFQNPNLDDETRITNLISLLTLEEKINCLSTDNSLPRLGIRGSGNSEGLHGLTQGGPGFSRQRIPTPTTVFPQAIGLAQMWDEETLQQISSQMAHEARYIYQSPKYNRAGLVVWGPNADFGRDPRWGRTEECYGEDPFLTSRLVTAFVKGLQGDDAKYWKTASLMKHFLANSNEYGRSFTSSDFDETLYRDYYSYSFYKGVTNGGSRAYMAAYNSYNGIPCTVHPMLKDITVNEWGQNGIICTDGGAFRLLMTDHKYFDTWEGAAAACIKAGINMFLDDYKASVKGALTQGLITEKDLDEVLRGRFRVVLKVGLLDNSPQNPYTMIGVSDTIDPWTKKETQEFARIVTARSVVLLKNDKNTLPLDASAIRSVAVIGPYADDVLMDWYGGHLSYKVSLLEGIQNAVGKDVKVVFVKSNKIDSAYIAAKECDAAIVCIGNHPWSNAGWEQSPVPSDGKEAVDRSAISLEQEDLAKIVYQANPRTIMVLVSSFPFAVNWSQENLPAILHVTHCSQELGNGVADVLFGKVNPAGRLVQTWNKSIDDLPPMLDYNIRNGRTYMYFKGRPLYPFGYGLSYTQFQYDNLRLSSASLSQNDGLTVDVDVKNTGKRDGDEVVQVYLKYPDGVQRLKGFKRIFIKSGETKTVTIPIDNESMGMWNVEKHDFVVPSGNYTIEVGASSADIRLKQDFLVK